MDAFERRDLFNRAADELEQRGWRRGALCGAVRGQVCMVGAVFAAYAGPGATREQIYSLSKKRWGKELPVDIGRMIEWNDHIAKSCQEVAERLRALARGENPFEGR